MGRSAFQLDEAWCGVGVPTRPAALRDILDSRLETRGMTLDVVLPEHRILFDTHGGEPRNADLAFVGKTPAGKVAVTVEAKADEPFGTTVSETLTAALERGIETPASKGVRRVEDLARALFRTRVSGQPKVADLRYQLLTATAGTLAFASAQGAPVAVLIVHEFVTDQTRDPNHEQNGRDYADFVQRLSGHPNADQSGRILHGPFSVPGAALFPGVRALFIGKVTANRRASRQFTGGSTPQFERYIGIDYSGAEVPTASLKGLRVFLADRNSTPQEVPPTPSLRKYWTRKGVAGWLVERLSEEPSTIVGIDHGFSFPMSYFNAHALPLDWTAFLDDFCFHWPTDDDHVYVDFVRDGSAGNGAARSGNTRWKRLTDRRAGSAKSLFHFDVQGSVAKSTHSGLPWLRFIRQHVTRPLHFWPFDGWEIPSGSSAMVEVYPRLWNRMYPVEGRNADQQDAWVVAEWMRTADANGALSSALQPALDVDGRKLAEIEGWILGVR
jgi:hypothetical protein